jgi:serine/threonine/tyrosine-interacting protein
LDHPPCENDYCRAKAFIDSAICDPPSKVLVHCNGGISLSPAFVVMFVMQYYHISWEEALRLVQNRRYCISPNGGFLTQIKVRANRHWVKM